MLLCLAACNKEKNYSLPPETQIGAGTFGCKVNGKVWVPNGSNSYSGQNVVSYYQYIYPSPSGFVFNITATKYNQKPIESISLGTDSMQIQQGMKLPLRTGYHNSGTGIGRLMQIGYSGTTQYLTNGTATGEVQFTRFDIPNRIASGTFWFDAYDSTSKETIHVTEGRFDVKFTI
jgi:hypothetical protein